MSAIAPVEQTHCISNRAPSHINSNTAIFISYTVQDGAAVPIKAHSAMPWKAP